MNILDAIKSGRSFRRQASTKWLSKNSLTMLMHCPVPEMFEMQQTAISAKRMGTKTVIDLSLEDFLADDWEIQEPTVTITRTMFWDAVAAIMKESGKTSLFALPIGSELTELAYRLGLDPNCRPKL